MTATINPHMNTMRTNDIGDATLNGEAFNGIHVADVDGRTEFVSATQILMVAEALRAANASDERGHTNADNRGKVMHALIALKRRALNGEL